MEIPQSAILLPRGKVFFSYFFPKDRNMPNVISAAGALGRNNTGFCMLGGAQDKNQNGTIPKTNKQ